MSPQEGEREVVVRTVFNRILFVVVDVERADEGSFGIDASGRVAVVVAAVVNHAKPKLTCVAAFVLDDAGIHIVFK